MDGICAIDLDTITPCLAISKLKNIPRIYDAHEFFTGSERSGNEAGDKKNLDKNRAKGSPEIQVGLYSERKLLPMNFTAFTELTMHHKKYSCAKTT
jgi:hypothetical protein